MESLRIPGLPAAMGFLSQAGFPGSKLFGFVFRV